MPWCVAGVVERIVGVLVLARSAWFVHAVTDGNPCRVGAGPGGRCGEEPSGCVVGVPRYGGVCVGAVEPWGHPGGRIRVLSRLVRRVVSLEWVGVAAF